MSSGLIQLPNGDLVGTGLLMPEVSPLGSMPVYEESDAFISYSDDELKAITAARTRRRVLWGADKITNQGSTNGCNGWAAAAAASRARSLAGKDYIKLSGASVYAQVNGGRDAGSHLLAGMQALQKKGALTESGSRSIWIRNYEDIEWASAYKADECYQAKTLHGLRCGLAAGFVAVVAVHVGRGYQSHSSGIVPVAGGGGNHAVCCDDLWWDSSRWIYDVPNSWGTSWGEQGRGQHVDDHFTQTIRVHYFYLIRSVADHKSDAVAPQI